MSRAPGGSDGVQIKRFMEDAEEKVEDAFRKSKKYLPSIGRLFLVSTFIDDGFRMITFWNEQVAFFKTQYPILVVYFILLINCFVQLGASGMVIVRKYTDQAVYALFFVLVFQTVLYSLLWSWNFLARNLALCGALVLLLADSRSSKRQDFAGIPSVGNEDNIKAYMQLTGRILVVLMFFTLIHPDMTPGRWGLTVLQLALMVCVVLGFKTKLAAAVLVSTLFVLNFVLNNFWSVPSWQYDFVKYDFFQTLSVIGGLVMVVSLGAGDLSVDERKKQY
eukprot:comp21515_c0_seq1/m.29865 comp21515_c0_seq1/g.29865  ORF comp21515_c0_seq1/g.29865 comp21515_c0_seq1/m.29865 type:complete len:277 (-) comp21515_c0_seq1:453-1283(-)